MAEIIGLDKGDLGRLERGTAKAERAGVSIGKAAFDAGKFAERVLNRLGHVIARAGAFLEGTGLEGEARQVADVALGTVAGARAGAAFGSVVPIVGAGAGLAAGAAIGAALGKQVEAGRVAGARATIEVQNAAFSREKRLEQIEADAEAKFNASEDARLAALRRVDLGQGDPARLSALRRAVRGAR